MAIHPLIRTTRVNPDYPPVAGFDDFVIAVVIAAAVGSAIANAVQTGIKTGSVGAAFKALGIGLGIAAVSAGLGAVATTLVAGMGAAGQVSLALAGAGAGAYNAYDSFAKGNYVGGALGVVSVLLAAYAAYGALTKGDPVEGAGKARGLQSRGLSNAEVDEYGSLFSGRDVPSDFWENIHLDDSSGIGDRGYTWRWPWSKEVTIHLGGLYSADPITGANEEAATLAHELGHALDFREGWFGTAVGALKDQVLFDFGADVYNPSLSSASRLSGFSVEGRATLYEWSYCLYSGLAPQPVPSNYPIAPSAQQRLYGILYP